MRAELYDFIQSNDDLKRFIREQPIWYRRLTRNPQEVEKFEIAMMNHYKKTIPDKVGKLQNQVQMASFLLEMFQTMRNNGK